MCDLATASLIATGLGTAAQAKAASQTRKAMNNVQAAESLRQKKMREEANAMFNESLGSEGQANTIKAEDKAIADRQAAAAAAQGTGSAADIGSSYDNKSQVVADESRVRGSAGKAASGMEAAAKAKLAGFGDAAQLNAIKNARMRLGQGIIAGNMAGSAAASGAELDFASHAGDNMKNIGSALSTIGTLTGMAAGAGVGSTTAEELANAEVASKGGLLGSDGTVLTGSSGGATGVFNPKTGAWNAVKDVKNIDFKNWVNQSHLDWANKPSYMKLFGNAPTGYVAAPSWFDKLK
ncbi:hypothetical protein UFOVP341_38 [uncultured Caudovirales phage]|uniref:Uncharacterized protein n=1 Tax=uncultured Caudovirales phage TaxID=2100421 RepID=A0A6J5LWI9_9CAUD|nr:hypothetical protein UFOVP341_38 [uncultured Caudovirales phage]